MIVFFTAHAVEKSENFYAGIMRFMASGGAAAADRKISFFRAQAEIVLVLLFFFIGKIAFWIFYYLGEFFHY